MFKTAASGKKRPCRLDSTRSWRPLTPPPVWGRRHVTTQTERYLEQLFEHPECVEIECQTDLFIDRPSSPYYVVEKVGEDVDTQIYPGDLWDFDREAHPIVEVLVGQTLHMSMIEVMEEDEIENMRAEQRRFEELREGERAEQRRLEEQERRLREEKERRVAQYNEAIRLQQETINSIAAAALTHGYLVDLLPNVLEGLSHAGYLLQDMKADIQEHVIPWLSENVNQYSEIKTQVNEIMNSIVRRTVEARALTYTLLGDSGDKEQREACIPLDPAVRSDSDIPDNYEYYIKNMGNEGTDVPKEPPKLPVCGIILSRKGHVKREVAHSMVDENKTSNEPVIEEQSDTNEATTDQSNT